MALTDNKWLGFNTTQIKTLQWHLDQVAGEGDTTALEEAVADLEDRTTAVEGDVSALDGRVTAIEEQLDD